jgi:hypothetical protein
MKSERYRSRADINSGGRLRVPFDQNRRTAKYREEASVESPMCTGFCARGFVLFAIMNHFRGIKLDFSCCLRNQNVNRWIRKHGCYRTCPAGFRFDDLDSQS